MLSRRKVETNRRKNEKGYKPGKYTNEEPFKWREI